jgi:aminoglycoside phosphotransferase (APT) family kinase protein
MSSPGEPSADIANRINLSRLHSFLLTQGVEVVGELSSELISGGKSNLTIRLTDGASRWIVRRPPLGDILPGAHNMSREYRVQAALATTKVPVPPMVALCEDHTLIGAPFYVMQEVVGDVIRDEDDVRDIAESVRRELGFALVDTLSTLHEVDYKSAGLADLGRPDGYLRRQVQRWNRQYEAIKVRDLLHVDAITTALHRSMPVHPSAALVHGDYRLDNMMVDRSDPASIVAVLEWELATL